MYLSRKFRLGKEIFLPEFQAAVAFSKMLAVRLFLSRKTSFLSPPKQQTLLSPYHENLS